MTRSGPEMHAFSDRETLYDELTREIAAILSAAVAQRGRATLAVPGGTTPAPLLDRLCETELPWRAVCVTLTDERWVDVGDAASNEGMLRRHLLRSRAAGAAVVGLKSGHEDPREAEQLCTQRLERLGQPLDAVVLGMGEDGHVASLFPGVIDPAVALDPHSPVRCIAVSPPMQAVAASHWRLSLTLAALVDTRRLLLLATGSAKRSLIERACSDRAEAVALPLTAVLRQQVAPAQVWWAP